MILICFLTHLLLIHLQVLALTTVVVMVSAVKMAFAIVNMGTLGPTALQVMRSLGFLSFVGLGSFFGKKMQKNLNCVGGLVD